MAEKRAQVMSSLRTLPTQRGGKSAEGLAKGGRWVAVWCTGSGGATAAAGITLGYPARPLHLSPGGQRSATSQHDGRGRRR